MSILHSRLTSNPMKTKDCVFILDETAGVIEQYEKTKVIPIKAPSPQPQHHMQLQPPPLVPISYPRTLTVPDNAPAEFVEVKIKVENAFSKKPRKPRISKVQCDVCSKEFPNRGRLSRHAETHNTMRERLTCDLCPQTCSDRWTLARHRRTHSGEKPFTCMLCGKTFTTPTGLKRHLTSHDPDSRTHLCKECPKRFPDRSSLLKHVLLHRGIKPHCCDICQKKFRLVGDLNHHKKIHLPVKPYSCDLCDRGFNRLSNLQRHRLVHKLSGEEDYKCDMCSVSFRHGGTLTRHMISAHPLRKKMITKRSPHDSPSPSPSPDPPLSPSGSELTGEVGSEVVVTSE